MRFCQCATELPGSKNRGLGLLMKPDIFACVPALSLLLAWCPWQSKEVFGRAKWAI